MHRGHKPSFYPTEESLPKGGNARKIASYRSPLVVDWAVANLDFNPDVAQDLAIAMSIDDPFIAHSKMCEGLPDLKLATTEQLTAVRAWACQLNIALSTKAAIVKALKQIQAMQNTQIYNVSTPLGDISTQQYANAAQPVAKRKYDAFQSHAVRKLREE